MKKPELSLDELIEEARKHQMTEKERRIQQINFAHGNVSLSWIKDGRGTAALDAWRDRRIAEIEAQFPEAINASTEMRLPEYPTRKMPEEGD